jgi:Family of unknown function (DUF6152)
MSRTIGVLLVAVLLGAVPASAHHSLSIYDRSSYKTVQGTVKRFEWANPHAQLALLVEGSDGSATEWNFEGGSTGRLQSGGFVRDAIVPGDKITVAYNPMRDGRIGGFFVAITTADGKTYSLERFRRLNPAE